MPYLLLEIDEEICNEDNIEHCKDRLMRLPEVVSIKEMKQVLEANELNWSGGSIEEAALYKEIE